MLPRADASIGPYRTAYVSIRQPCGRANTRGRTMFAPYRTCVLICRGRRPRRPAMTPTPVTRLSHNFPTFFKFRSFSFHIRRVYCKCSQEGSRDPERERDPKFFHPYSSFLLTPGRCRKIPAPLWCFFGTICRFLVQRLQFDRIYIIIETLPIVAKNRIIS